MLFCSLSELECDVVDPVYLLTSAPTFFGGGISTELPAAVNARGVISKDPSSFISHFYHH